MSSNCDSLSWAQFIALLLVLIWEYWLGRTPRLKASSTISLIATLAAAIIVRLIQKEKNDGKSV